MQMRSAAIATAAEMAQPSSNGSVRRALMLSILLISGLWLRGMRAVENVSQVFGKNPSAPGSPDESVPSTTG